MSRLETHRVNVYETTGGAPTDSIAAEPIHSGLSCCILAQEQGRAVLGRARVEFSDSLGMSHYLLAVGRYSDVLTSGRVVQVTHQKCPVLRHWKPLGETERYLVLSVVTQAGATRHSYAAMRRV